MDDVCSGCEWMVLSFWHATSNCLTVWLNVRRGKAHDNNNTHHQTTCHWCHIAVSIYRFQFLATLFWIVPSCRSFHFRLLWADFLTIPSYSLMLLPVPNMEVSLGINLKTFSLVNVWCREVFLRMTEPRFGAIPITLPQPGVNGDGNRLAGIHIPSGFLQTRNRSLEFQICQMCFSF